MAERGAESDESWPGDRRGFWGASGENMVKGVYVAGKWRGQGNRERVNDRSFIPENEDGRVSLSAPKSGVGEPLRIR